MRHLRLLPLLLMFVGCGISGAISGTGGGSRDGVSGTISGITGTSSDASTEDFDVRVVQAETGIAMRDQNETDVKFEITITNRTKEPYTIRRVTLQTMAGAGFGVGTNTRKFRKTIEAGKSATVDYWATATVDEIGTPKNPATLRALIEVVSAAGAKRQETFIARINGRVQLDAVKIQ